MDNNQQNMTNLDSMNLKWEAAEWQEKESLKVTMGNKVYSNFSTLTNELGDLKEKKYPIWQG